MAVGPDELIRPLTGLVFIPTGCRATLLTSKETTKRSWWGSRFRRRPPVHVAGCTGLHVSSSRYHPDLTIIIIINIVIIIIITIIIIIIIITIIIIIIIII